jgi:branched-chain amino acid transport system ATP-binding protein
VLEVRNLDAGYEFLQVLWGVSLRVGEGEFVALVGPNGSGKTTLLKTIAGLLGLRQGEILYRGKRIDGLSAHQICRMGVGQVSETLNLFQAMSVYENLWLGAYAVRERARKVASLGFVFDVFPRLRERRGQLAGTLSGGERKMLAIGRALMSSPVLLLVDEPSLGLSPQSTMSVFRALETLHDRGTTILLVEQNVSMTLNITDRAYVLEQGRMVLEGRSRDLLKDGKVQKAYLGL